MSSMSTYLKGKLAEEVLRGVNYTTPGEIYLALYTSNPGVGNTGAEAAYTGYARVSCGATPSSAFTALSGATSQNSNTITFPAVGGATSVTVTHWALFDASSGGNLLLFGALTASKTLDPTDVPSFPAGALQLTWN